MTVRTHNITLGYLSQNVSASASHPRTDIEQLLPTNMVEIHANTRVLNTTISARNILEDGKLITSLSAIVTLIGAHTLRVTLLVQACIGGANNWVSLCHTTIINDVVQESKEYCHL